MSVSSLIYTVATRVWARQGVNARGLIRSQQVKAYQEAQEQTQTDLSRSRSPRFSTRYSKLSRRGYRHAKVVLRIASVSSRTTALTSAHGDEMAARDSEPLETTGTGRRE